MRLIHAASDTQIWSATFAKEPREVMALHGEVAQSIARNINIELTQAESARLRAPRAVDPRAHTAYLLGRHFWNERTDAGFAQAVEHFQRAIDIDPDYALAYAGLADVHVLWDEPSSAAGLDLAQAAARRALELDPYLAEAHTALAFASVFKWDWEEAGEGFRRALDLAPSYATAHHWYGNWLSWTGRHDEAIRHLERARAIDPLSLILGSARPGPTRQLEARTGWATG